MKKIILIIFSCVMLLEIPYPSTAQNQNNNPCQVCLQELLDNMLGDQCNNQGFSCNKLLFYYIGQNNNSTDLTDTYKNNYGNSTNNADNWTNSTFNLLGLNTGQVLLYIAEYQACRAANGCN